MEDRLTPFCDPIRWSCLGGLLVADSLHCVVPLQWKTERKEEEGVRYTIHETQRWSEGLWRGNELFHVE
jgi:hypothetical protein